MRSYNKDQLPANLEKSSQWNEALANLTAEVRRFFNRAEVDGDWRKYSEKLTTYNKVSKARKQRLMRFCEIVTSTAAAARLRRAMVRGKIICVIALKKPDGSHMEEETESARLFLETHFPGSKKPTK